MLVTLLRWAERRLNSIRLDWTFVSEPTVAEHGLCDCFCLVANVVRYRLKRRLLALRTAELRVFETLA